MQIIRRRAYARAGLIGNPSDGYFGKTIAVIVKNFFAEVTLYEWPTVEVVWSQDDQSIFRSIHELAEDVQLHGYYGGVRLVKATIKRFHDYCIQRQIPLHDRNFSVRYSTGIPRAVGLAGSSAIIVATLRALMDFYEVKIPLHLQPALALSVETKELGIAAGLQDRVAQVYEGLVFMDFARERKQSDGDLSYGVYERLDPKCLPPLYVAYSADVGEPTYVVHNPLRARFEQGEPAVVQAMKRFAELTVEAREALGRGDHQRLHELMNANFDLRASICQISPQHREMIDVARGVGASAKFAGSGGAIIGTFRDAEMFSELQRELSRIGTKVVRPMISEPCPG